MVLPGSWMLMLLQGKISSGQLVEEFAGKLTSREAQILISRITDGMLKDRNRAISVLADLNDISLKNITDFLMIDERTIRGYLTQYRMNGIDGLFLFRSQMPKKHEKTEYKEALFSILHTPPHDYGIYRTSWKMDDLHRIMGEKGFPICNHGIRMIIKNEGFKFRKAKKVLTSTDPLYRQKLKVITTILRNLSDSESFFSIDEFGPFAVKKQGGKALIGPGQEHVVPQWQKSKGSLIITAALELSTNQVTHFFSKRKNTEEMIKMLNIIIKKYSDNSIVYFSWDAASWHASRKLKRKVDEINSFAYSTKSPIVKLAPLPKSAQFLNIIESIFSGMARAIIHNSDYESIEECKLAIDRYFEERNQYFLENPKRAGNKIWGNERVKSVFNESNNCKDPYYM